MARLSSGSQDRTPARIVGVPRPRTAGMSAASRLYGRGTPSREAVNGAFQFGQPRSSTSQDRGGATPSHRAEWARHPVP